MTKNHPYTDRKDRLGREQEVELISSLLVEQANARPEHSFVLALDSQYGTGKSFFLELLAEKLSQNHPVARVDAWADDSGNEPSVSIMAAIEEALEPYLFKPAAGDALEKLKAARRNILPILAKGAGGALTKAIARYFDDVAVDQIRDLLNQRGEDISSEAAAIGEGAGAGIEAIGDRLTELADRHAQDLIKDYRDRKRSRVEFKKSMAQMIASLVPSGVEKIAPLIVIVDELDRCRPDYAIKVLEEIKHFFDVPGVAFVLAIHRPQLSASVQSVYGANFKSDDYLRRFFDWSMTLRPRSMSALVTDQMIELGLDWQRMRSPPKNEHMKNVEGDHEDYIAFILSTMNVTPREAKAVMRALALFFQSWDAEVRVELTALIPKLIAMVRGEAVSETYLDSAQLSKYSSMFRMGGDRTIGLGRLYNHLITMATESLLHTRQGPDRDIVGADYLRSVFSEEYSILVKRNTGGEWRVPPSLIGTYDERVRLVDRLTD